MRRAIRSGLDDARRHPLLESSARSPIKEANRIAGGLEAEIAPLEKLSRDEFRLRWRNRWGRLAPALFSRGLLFRLMAYRVQAEAFGDLDGRTVRLLDRLAGDAVGKSSSGAYSGDHQSDGAKVGAAGASSVRQPSEPLILKPGALLTREWKNRIERAMVVKDGFAWNGETYGNLSAVAFAITGTKWNGHRFFGVRPQDRIGSHAPNAEEKRDKRAIRASVASHRRAGEGHRSSHTRQHSEGDEANVGEVAAEKRTDRASRAAP